MAFGEGQRLVAKVSSRLNRHERTSGANCTVAVGVSSLLY